MSLSLTDPAELDAPLAPGLASRVLLWSILGFCSVMIAWAAVAEVNETASAPGRIVPQRPLQVISHADGGVVSAILVRPGDIVAAGAPLLRLDPGGAAADFGRSSAAANALSARIVRLEAEAAGRTPLFPAALTVAAPGAVAAEQALWQAHQRDVTNGSAGVSARIDGARRALAEAEATAASSAEARAQAAREVAMLAPLVDKGIEPRLTLDRARSSLVQADASAAGSAAAVARSRAAVAEAQSAAAAVTDRWRAEASRELTQARAELAGQQAGLPNLQRRLARAEVRSPVTGTVQRVLVGTVGSAVAPGAPLVEVVPKDGALAIAARVRPADIGFVHLGQPAAVRITAYDSSLYGTLKGRVTRISPDSVVDERAGEGWYEVRIETSQAVLTGPTGGKVAIGSGMVADVALLGAPRTVLSYLLSPVARLREDAFRER
jgi:membrane fusion protein, adhesin transport system